MPYVKLVSELEVTELEIREAAEIDWFPGDWVICRTYDA